MPENNSAPLEIIAVPSDVYWGELGVAFPKVDEVPDPTDWNLLGTSGSLNYGDSEGVTVTHNQTIQKFRALGDCGVRKNFRTEEDQMVQLNLVDVTLEQYRLALNNNAITTVPAGPNAGYKKIGLSRGFNIKTVQLLVRALASPEMTNGAMQYEIPRCQFTGSPQAKFMKGTPVGLAVEYTALVDPDAASADERFGRLIVETLEAIS